MNEQYAELKATQNKKKIIEAYQRFERKEPGSHDALLKAVIEFAQRKHLRYEFKESGFAGVPSAMDFEDSAQEAVIAVWQGLPSFRGDAANFFSWMNSIVFKKGIDFYNELLETKKTRVPLTVVVNDEEGGVEEVDNPQLYNDDEGVDRPVRIPESIQGTDRLICHLILDGNSYRRIAYEMDLTEAAVKQRMARLRKRMKAEREAKQQAQEESLAKRPPRATRAVPKELAEVKA